VGVVKVPADLIERGLIDTARVERGSFGTGLELTGEIRFDERRIAHLSPRLPGIIRRVFVDLGQSVSGGAPLVELGSPELAEAQAGYLTALAEHKLARRNYERQSELREAKISSEREFLEADRSLETARIRSNSGRQRLLRLGITEGEIAELESEGIAGATGRYLLKAPFAGEVLDLHGVRGEQVELDSELALFGSTETLWVWVDLYESYLDAVSSAKVESGIEAKVSVHAYPGETFEGKLDFIGSTMSEDTRTVKARVTLENADGRLKPGMFATVILLLGDHREAPAVPSSAVLSDEGREFVFVHRLEDYFLRREVRTGRTIGGFVEILAGLSPGQTITARGSFLLKSDVLRSKMGEGCAH
jgi:cobalt-zinc-cadmium efflux system membrane fusion protein